jgi:acetyl esterase/lipase
MRCCASPVNPTTAWLLPCGVPVATCASACTANAAVSWGGRDELVWLRQSERLAERLTEVGVNHLLVRLQWADHGFDANLWGPASQIYLYVLERFLAAVTQ